jgi:hypothetical protein
MRQQNTKNPSVPQSELIGAALRYCAVADWFEARPCPWSNAMSLDQAMEVFNRAESELRRLGAQALRQRGHRDLVLQSAGVHRRTEAARR